MNPELIQRIKKYGVTRLARQMGVGDTCVHNWFHRGLPPDKIIYISAKFNVPLCELSPVLYPKWLFGKMIAKMPEAA